MDLCKSSAARSLMLDDLDHPALGILLGGVGLVTGDHLFQLFIGEVFHVAPFNRYLGGLRPPAIRYGSSAKRWRR